MSRCCPALPPGMSCVLRHLDLSYNRVGDAGAAALSSALAGGAESPVPLQHLELAGNQVGGIMLVLAACAGARGVEGCPSMCAAR
jgi:hypothetical protein